MKRIIAVTTTILLVICLSTVTAHADRKTMEGFMLGAGAFILGSAIYNAHHDSVQYIPQKTTNYKYSHNRYNSNYRYKYKGKHNKKYNRHDKKGHWKTKKRWVDPLYKKRWNPGHYNRKGQWISGRKVSFLVKQGYWQKKKVWVRY
jgi:hypothetical protein